MVNLKEIGHCATSCQEFFSLDAHFSHIRHKHRVIQADREARNLLMSTSRFRLRGHPQTLAKPQLARGPFDIRREIDQDWQ